MAKNKLQKFEELRRLTNTIQPDKSDLLNDRYLLKVILILGASCYVYVRAMFMSVHL